MHSRVIRKLTLLVAVAVTALVAATSASAEIVVPNPGFESDCGGVPCSWTPIAGTGTRDTVNPRSGSASFKLAMPSTSPNQATAQTACFNASVAAGSVPVSYWYRATAGISGVAMTVGAYAGAGCSSLIVQSSIQPATLDTTNTWKLVSSSMTLGSAAQSFKITLAGGCTSGCSSSKTVNFDDLSVGQAPTAVTLVSFRGTRTAHGVRLAWKTAAASQVAGFNVYRGHTKLNRTLIANSRGLSGAYAWVDRAIGRNARPSTYRLQAVKLDGTRAWLGTATA